MIVGAPAYDNGESNEGRAFVYLGSASGPGLSAAWTAEGNQSGVHFGSSVGTAGDVNGDGFSDVIIGAPYYDNGEQNEGRAFVYHGSASGLGPSPAWTAEGDQDYADFGISVGTAGDVNGDGFSDVIVGAPSYSNDQANEGRAFVYHGSASGLSGSPAWTAESNQSQAYFGASVGTAGDVNGDGFSDVIVGAPYYDDVDLDAEGRAVVYHGSASGLGLSPAWAAEGDQAQAFFGNSVGTAGDVNGDGFSDVIVGADYYDHGEENEGRAFAYYGSFAGLVPFPSWSAEGNQAFANFGCSVGSAGDVNGDGYSDVIVGAPYHANPLAGEGRAAVYHGSATGLGASAAWILPKGSVPLRYRLAWISFLLMLSVAAPALACDLCAVYRATEARASKEGWYTGVFEQYTRFGTLRDNGQKVDNPTGQYMNSSNTQLFVGYQVNEKFGLQLNVPYIHRTYKRPTGVAGNPAPTESGTVSGLGDIALTGSFQGYHYRTEKSTLIWTILGGIKFPPEAPTV